MPPHPAQNCVQVAARALTAPWYLHHTSGFTAAASEVSAAEVVLLLDRVFSEYDR